MIYTPAITLPVNEFRFVRRGMLEKFGGMSEVRSSSKLTKQNHIFV